MCKATAAILITSFIACSSDDAKPDYAGDFDVRWSGPPDSPLLDSAEIVDGTGDATHVFYLGNNRMTDMTLIRERTLSCSPSGDGIFCDNPVTRESAQLRAVDGENIEGWYANDDGSWIIALARR